MSEPRAKELDGDIGYSRMQGEVHHVSVLLYRTSCRVHERTVAVLVVIVICSHEEVGVAVEVHES
jgi:hypothetical protein